MSSRAEQKKKKEKTYSTRKHPPKTGQKGSPINYLENFRAKRGLGNLSRERKERRWGRCLSEAVARGHNAVLTAFSDVIRFWRDTQTGNVGGD